MEKPETDIDETGTAVSAVLLRCTFAWFGLFALAFVNGAVRELCIKRYIKEPHAHRHA